MQAKSLQLYLVDLNSELVRAWKDAFQDFPEVKILQEDLLAVAQGCAVSPANSYGFMDGGIDAAYCRFFGPAIEEQVRKAIGLRPEGMLPVGASIVVRTGNERIPYLIVAPTMVMPEEVQSRNSYRAMRAVLRIAETQPEIAREIYCPGLGTGVGNVSPGDAAMMMARAYSDWLKR